MRIRRSPAEEVSARRQRLLQRLRGLRPRPVSAIVLAIGIAATIAAFFLARDWVDQREYEALSEQADRAAETLASLASTSNTAIRVASALAAATADDPARFDELMAPRLPPGRIAYVALVRLDGDSAVPVASVGRSPPTLVRELTAPELAQLRRLAELGVVGAVATRVQGGNRVGLVGAPGTPDGSFAVAMELRFSLLTSRSDVLSTESADFAVYLGPTVDSGALLTASTADLPLEGLAVTQPIEILGAEATLVVAERAPIVTGVRGELHWLVLAVGLLLAGASAGIVEVSRRRSEAEERSRALAIENEQLIALDRQKDEFISLVSHDLRTPLTAIIGYTDVLEDDVGTMLDPEHRRFLEVIARNGERLLGLVEDLLFMARLQAGRLELAQTRLDLSEVAAGAVEAVRPQAEAAGIDLVGGLDGPVRLWGDAKRLGQLVDNLISNALKFTPPGGRVTVRASEEPDHGVLEVADTGIGIPSDELDHLFDRFYRASAATERQVPGTGLGLAIAKAIVDAHGGTIAVRSTVGGGTTFRVELPAAAPSEAATLAGAEQGRLNAESSG